MASCTSLTLRWKEEFFPFTFLPVGRAFFGGSRCSVVPLAESIMPYQGEIGPLGNAFIEEVTALSDPPIMGRL